VKGKGFGPFGTIYFSHNDYINKSRELRNEANSGRRSTRVDNNNKQNKN
jgi:hypothetical protein